MNLDICATCNEEASTGLRYYTQRGGSLVWVCILCLPQVLSVGLSAMDYTRHDKAQTAGDRRG